MCRVTIRADALTLCTWLLLIAFAVGCNNDPAPTNDPLRKHFAVTIPELLVRYQVPGLAIAVVRDGELAFADGYGLANVKTSQPVTSDTLFNAGSISKVVSAWGVMRLVDRGVLSLDAPVETYLSRWNLPEADFDKKAVTTRRIMSHTAGFTMHSIPGFEVPQPLPKLEAILAGDYEGSVYTNGGTPIAFFSEPGSTYRYSGGGFVLLELLVEELTLDRFPEYMDREVLRPLGMISSRFGWRDELAEKAAVPYRSNGRPYPMYRFSGVAGAGLYTSVTDLARFAAAGLTSETSQPGRDVLEPQTVELMFKRVRLTDGAPSPCGLAYFLEPPNAKLREANHGGGNNGWRAMMIPPPDQGKGIVILTNSDNSVDLLSELVGAWRKFEVDAFLVKEVLILLAGIVLLGLLILIALSRVGRLPKAGLLEVRLRPCPGRPN
jgi:CubicO group peptidase (beta-lactamase class C family)